MKLSLYTCLECINISDAIKKIDFNKKGFLVVVNELNEVTGTVTDGDIRRSILRSVDLNEKVSTITTKNYKFLYESMEVVDALEIFKNESVKFLPIITKDKKLINIVTKNQMHVFVMRDIIGDLKYDFDSIDENEMNTEIYTRPWGYYKTTLLNNYYQSKIIKVNPGKRLSLQSHNRRDEYWVIVHGHGKITLGETINEIKPGDFFYIPRNMKHRVENTKDENLIINEVQFGDYFGEDDITRYEDDYGRIK